MEAMPSALVKDLLSTGYFYAELRGYGDSKEIDLATYMRNYTIPYLIKTSDKYRESGQLERHAVYNLVTENLMDVDDSTLAECILGLKKIVADTIDSNEKVLHQLNLDDISRRVSHRKSESAQTVAKLLVSIIKMFKLAESATKRKTHQAADNTLTDLQELPIPAK